MLKRFMIVLALVTLAIPPVSCSSAEPVKGKADAVKGVEKAGRTGGDIADHPLKLKFKPLKFDPPKASDYRVKLPNGMILYIAEDRELPTFDMEVTVRTGSLYEPEEKTGLASACGNLMKKGGTKSMTGEEIDDYMAQLAGRLESRIGFTSGTVSLSVLKEDIDNGLKVLADVLMNPVFVEDEIRRYREKTLQGLRHRYDRARSILGDTSGKLLYGGHPAGRVTKKSTINSITRDDLLAFHKKYFYPNNCIVAVAGDFERGAMIKKIEKLFSGWKQGKVDFPEVPAVEIKFKKGVFLLEKEINQGYVRIGHVGIREDNPDVYTVRIMNAVLGGGGFMSRIPNRVRNDEGLAYSVGSWFDIPVEYTGMFLCSFQTKAKSVAFAVSIVMEEVNRIRTELVSEEELKRAKDLYIERFPSIFSGRGSSAYAKVKVLAGNEYNKRPLDYYEHYRDNYRKVTREKVLEVAKKYLNPDGLKVVVVGKIEEMKKGDGRHKDRLEDFGEVKQLKPPNLMK
ncbi:MAG: insulinase family protein [Planctomycetota bacterium]|nr:MAG: insulinase family protein [Planctomycetota bacterium]